MTTKEKIVVRIPPSPTGFFHVGRARTALFNYLYAKKHGGVIVFRLEDTDKERSKKEYEEDIISSLAWLGITYDQGPFKQSERNEVYKEYIQKMLDEGSAYISHETEGINKEVIRFKNPNKIVTFTDEIRGEISFDTTELKDFVIARNINDPLYHLTVVVDDHEMGITHIIRGDDGISNTPRQILLQEAIGATRPIYAHVPLILAPDKSKMSARHGATSLKDFRQEGYLPQAMVNFLALLGFNPGGEKEVYTMEELIEVFALNRIQKGGAVFNVEKLKWFQKEHIKLLPQEVQDKMKLAEIKDEPYVTTAPQLNSEKICWKSETKENTKLHLTKVLDLLESASFINKETVSSTVLPYAEEMGKGNVLWPLRYALSGQEKSPDPFTLLALLGKDESIHRIHVALSLL